MKRFFLALIFLALAAKAEATVYWVATTGSDANACSAVDSVDEATDPGVYKLTINSAIGCASAGDTVFVKSGIYTSLVTINKTGTSSNKLTIKSQTLEGAIIRATTNSTPAIEFSVGVSWVILDGFDIDGVNAGALDAGGVGAEDGTATNLEIRYNRIRRWTGQTTLVGADNSWAHHNKLEDTSTLADSGGNNTHGFYWGGVNNLFEYNSCSNVGGTQGYCFHIYSFGGTNNNVVRFNTITGGAAGFFIGAGTGNSAHHNICNATIFHCGQVAGAGASDNLVYNNTARNPGDGVAFYNQATNTTFKNNLCLDVSGSCITVQSGSTTQSNQISGTCANHAVNCAGGDFSLIPTSTAIDTGTSSITGAITLTCAGTCDVGVFEVPKASSCSATGNTLSILFDNPRFPPLSNLAVTGITGTIDGSSRTLSAPTLIGSNQVDFTFSGAAVVTTTTAAGSTAVTITDSANIGNVAANDQKVLNWAAINCNVAGGGAAVVTQTYFRFHDLPGTEAAPKCLSASGACSTMQNVNATIQQNGCFRCRIKIACTGADCLAFAPAGRYSPSGGAYTAIPNAFAADNIKYYGTSDTSSDIPTHLSTVATELLTSDHAINITAAFLRSADSVPNLDLSQNSESEIEFAGCIDRDETVGTTYDFRLYTGAGVALNAYDATPTITVSAPGPR